MLAPMMEKKDTAEGQIASAEREVLAGQERLLEFYLERVKVLKKSIEMLKKGMGRKLPLSGIPPKRAAIEYLKLHPGQQPYMKVVEHLVSQGCCDDTKFPYRSVSGGLSKAVRDGDLKSDSPDSPKFIWLP